jgi:RNA polymerase-binding transcription factor DksA
MNEKRAQAYRQRLLEIGDRIKDDVAAMREAALRGTGGDPSGNLSNTPMHLADLATDNFQQEVAAGVLQNEQQALAAIAAALDRLDAGTYGRCEGCGRAIPEGRLQALPYASQCVACEERLEKEEGVDLGQGAG